MKLENTITFTLYPQYDDMKTIPSKLTPKNYKQRVWLPQSIGDCVWLWIEFETYEEKEIHIKYLKTIFTEKELEDITITRISQESIDKYLKGDTAKNISFDYLTGSKTSRN